MRRRAVARVIEAIALFAAGFLLRDSQGEISTGTGLLSAGISLVTVVLASIYEEHTNKLDLDRQMRMLLGDHDWSGDVSLIVYRPGAWRRRAVTLGYACKEPKHLVPVTKRITPTGHIDRKIRRCDPKKGIVGTAYQRGQGLVFADTFADETELKERSVQEYDMQPEDLSGPMHNLEKRSVCCVPVTRDDEVHAIVYLNSNNSDDFGGLRGAVSFGDREDRYANYKLFVLSKAIRGLCDDYIR